MPREKIFALKFNGVPIEDSEVFKSIKAFSPTWMPKTIPATEANLKKYEKHLIRQKQIEEHQLRLQQGSPTHTSNKNNRSTARWRNSLQSVSSFKNQIDASASKMVGGRHHSSKNNSWMLGTGLNTPHSSGDLSN